MTPATTEAAAPDRVSSNAVAADGSLPSGAAPTSLFSSAPAAVAVDDYGQYRALSASAVISLVIGAISAIALLDFWILKAVPALGMVLGLSALQRIRSRPDELSGLKQARIGLALSAFFLLASVGWGAFRYVNEVPEGYVRISYEQLKNPDERMRNFASPQAMELEGKRVFIKGYMFPPPHETGVTRFVLCRDNGDCCFGGQPPPSDMVFIELAQGLDTNYDQRIRHVAGTFHVANFQSSDVGKQVLYRLDADYIK